MSSLKYWVWLSNLKGVKPSGMNKILRIFGSPEKAYFSRDREIDGETELSEDEKAALKVKNIGSAGRIIDSCREKGIRILTIGDAEYPNRLKNIYDPPVVLYTKGHIPVIDDECAVAVVGTRTCTPYGIKHAERISYELARAGCVIVTGLARGIDSAAAMGALRAGGKVIGVLGNGLDIVYPADNGRLYEDVCVNGGLISEYPPGTRPLSRNFPVRNRIMSGMSLGVLVVEAPKRSGALITASRALEQGRDVFAVPGNVDAEASEGSNLLIREGAALITCGMDIIEEYLPLYPEKLRDLKKDELIGLDDKNTARLVERELISDKLRQNQTKKPIDKKKAVAYIDLKEKPDDMSDDEYEVLKALEGELQADEIVEKTGLSAGKVLAALTVLEIRGDVRQTPGKRFSRM